MNQPANIPSPSLIPPPTRVIGCGMIAREILAICDQLSLSHIDLKCLPAMWHHHPEKIAPGVESAILQARKEGFEQIFIGYADCGTGGQLDAVCEANNVERIPGPHCFSFYLGNEVFESEANELFTCFYMTDFLARSFETFLVKPLGLDKHPELLDMYFGNYTKMIYMAQTEDEKLTQNAIAAADFLGLEYEKRYTGYGDLATTLETLQPK